MLIRTKSKKKPPRIVAYGGAGVGKTYFGSQMPNPIFVLTEDGMGTIDAQQFPLFKSFDDVNRMAGIITQIRNQVQKEGLQLTKNQ